MQSIIDHTPNLKHKAIIATMYSSGLRVSEVVHLHYDDISRTNKTIHVRESKSRRDRYTILQYLYDQGQLETYANEVYDTVMQKYFFRTFKEQFPDWI